ncbi:MAG TPA: xanthine dehydrogenase accessory protein XdhC [Microvirga sp.]|jgi:xanthine dehydrogenase accessory factor|nr:xanthine dehydrogenase accessory protein XdhC [Microvirga sp.]
MILWRRLAGIVAEHGAAALVSVHEARGSTPREAGARLIVRPDGAFHGTIGGGGLEWAMLGQARDALSRGRGAARFIEQALGPDLGQCCGGWVRVLVETFDGRDLSKLEALARREGEGPFSAECRIGDDGRVARTFNPPPSAGEGGERSEPGEGPYVRTAPLPTRADAGDTLPRRGGRDARWRETYGEQVAPVLLFGAGHVGRALVLALAPLPFSVRWIDSRDEAFPAHIPANATPVRTADLEGEVARAPADALLLVTTHDHALDLAITAAALRRDLPFVGLIGSGTKRARFERRFRELGIAEARIRSLVCPIGVPGIVSKEPAVIAASVAAQLLAERERIAALSEHPAERLRHPHDHALPR